MRLLNSFNASSYCIEQGSDSLKNDTIPLSCTNPLYSGGFSYTDKCNKVGTIHYIF